MIAEVFRNAYDATGRAVFKPSRHRYAKLSPNSPVGRHVTQPLSVLCRDLSEVSRPFDLAFPTQPQGRVSRPSLAPLFSVHSRGIRLSP
jgi:hypothetical protein